MTWGRDFSIYSGVSGVYMIINKENWRVYVGSSVNIGSRWMQHLSGLNRDIHPNSRLQDDWNRMGKNYFKFVLIEEVDIESLRAREGYWINNKKSKDMKMGYNIQDVIVPEAQLQYKIRVLQEV